MMVTGEQILEAITEAIRKSRQYGPGFPTPFDLGRIIPNIEQCRIEIDLEDGRKFDLTLLEVDVHGEEY